MDNKLRTGVVTVLAVTALVGGCATESNSNSVYSTGQAQREQTVRYGVVEGVRDVMIQGSQTGAGTLAGGAIGGVAAGSLIGSGNGSVAAGILGAVLGGIAGSATENKVNQRRAPRSPCGSRTARCARSRRRADELFRPGERVRLLTSGGVTRVTH